MYRSVDSITADELLSVLPRGRENAKHQVELFTQLGGDPNDHRYAYLSFRTKELRERGINVQSSRSRGLWL